MQGADALARPGMYVGVFSVPAGTIRYLARVGDPRDVRGESLAPTSSAVFVRLNAGTYSARVPFIPTALAVGFEVDTGGAISHVDYYLPFGPMPPTRSGLRYTVVRD